MSQDKGKPAGKIVQKGVTSREGKVSAKNLVGGDIRQHDVKGERGVTAFIGGPGDASGASSSALGPAPDPSSTSPAPDATEIRAILFMDVSGWSKLGAVEIRRYVQQALPQLRPALGEPSFLNTWGDAIVVTYASAQAAARAALAIRDFFTRATPDDGVPEGLVCRISLHQGEVILCNNALTGARDIFGDAVHLAARLEPATAPRHVFCTPAFAEALKAIQGFGPKARHLGPVKLPKGYGVVDASVVTHQNEADPTAGLQEWVTGKDAGAAAKG